MIGLIAVLVLASQESTPAPNPPTPPAKEPPMVCKQVPRPQSRFFDRVCMTEDQWRDINDQTDSRRDQYRIQPELRR